MLVVVLAGPPSLNDSNYVRWREVKIRDGYKQGESEQDLPSFVQRHRCP